jgi:membrane fusion protein (multidrug efflux system)
MENKETSKKKSKTLPVVLGLILLTGLIFGVREYVYSLYHEVTDDAQLEGDICPVLARVSGYIVEIRFEENQLVHKGDTLVRIDESDLRIRVEQAEAALENALASAAVARADISTARANAAAGISAVAAAKTRAWKSANDYLRFSNLLRDSAVTTQQYESAKADKESMEAMLQAEVSKNEVAGTSITAAEKQLAVAEAVVSQRKADLDFARLQLSYCVITAPESGFTSRKNIQPGQFVNAGSPLFALVRNTEVFVVANFKETQLNNMEPGEAAVIKIDAYPDTVFAGRVHGFSPATGAKFSLLPPDNATGNFVKVVQRIPVKIVFDGERQIREMLRPGMSVKVAVTTD